MFLLGSIDPWHFLSVLKSDVSLSEIAVFINGTAHCADMASDKSTDPQSLKDARLVSTLSFYYFYSTELFYDNKLILAFHGF